MTAIDRAAFVKECLSSSDFFGTSAHYMVAIAQLRSKIDDAKTGDTFGPFGLKQTLWDEQRSDPDLNLAANEITDWKSQCALVACWTRKVQLDLVQATGADTTAQDIYKKQFPGDAATGLDQALTDTKGLMPADQQVADAHAALPADHG